jgi:hypothetical protein
MLTLIHKNMYYGQMAMYGIVNIFLEKMSGLSPAYLSVYHSLACVHVCVCACVLCVCLCVSLLRHVL